MNTILQLKPENVLFHIFRNTYLNCFCYERIKNLMTNSQLGIKVSNLNSLSFEYHLPFCRKTDSNFNLISIGSDVLRWSFNKSWENTVSLILGRRPPHQMAGGLDWVGTTEQRNISLLFRWLEIDRNSHRMT